MYYVYGHKEKGKDEYVYIGHGKKRRARQTVGEHKKLMGIKELDVDIISQHSTKEEAFLYEKHNINMHKPKLNKTIYKSGDGKKTAELTPTEVDLRKKERIAHYQRLKNT